MDFIERYLGFSPDNGDGSFEAMLVTIITGFCWVYSERHVRRYKHFDMGQRLSARRHDYA
jgi:hypothetical protein